MLSARMGSSTKKSAEDSRDLGVHTQDAGPAMTDSLPTAKDRADMIGLCSEGRESESFPNSQTERVAISSPGDVGTKIYMVLLA